jgi:hypothetical protein
MYSRSVWATIVKRSGLSYPTFVLHYAGKSELWHDITNGHGNYGAGI